MAFTIDINGSERANDVDLPFEWQGAKSKVGPALNGLDGR